MGRPEAFSSLTRHVWSRAHHPATTRDELPFSVNSVRTQVADTVLSTGHCNQELLKLSRPRPAEESLAIIIVHSSGRSIDGFLHHVAAQQARYATAPPFLSVLCSSTTVPPSVHFHSFCTLPPRFAHWHAIKSIPQLRSACMSIEGAWRGGSSMTSGSRSACDPIYAYAGVSVHCIVEEKYDGYTEKCSKMHPAFQKAHFAVGPAHQDARREGGTFWPVRRPS